jgi:hypothetical protein
MESGQQLTTSSQTTVANTTAKSFLAAASLTAGQIAVGNTLYIKAWGLFSCTGTPTLTLSSVLGTSVSGGGFGSTGAMTLASGVTNRAWVAEQNVVCTATGTSATWFGPFRADVANTTSSPPWSSFTQVLDGTATLTQDSTVALNFGIAATWGTASASNTITCYGFTAVLYQ